jgi:DNA polymerase-3 subunit epsilon
MARTPRTVIAGQRSLDELGRPLHQVTFCVIDLETTGASPEECSITEVGAVKLCGGECQGTLQTLVSPGSSIPRSISVLTGITDAMVEPAPPVEAVLPTLLEFIGDAVIVGHNVRFDVAFLNTALRRSERALLGNPIIDTCALARRLVREEVPDCRLGTLADRFRLPHRPTHRALDDALATGDLLHALLERAAAFGVLGLDDLIELPTMGRHPQAGKLRHTAALPRTPGVYIFRDRAGRALYVGKATNLRARVRSYFSSDDRRKIGPMLREMQSVDHVVCRSTLEAGVLESRLIAQLLPRYNRRGTRWKKYVYMKLTTEAFPRLAIVRAPKRDGSHYLGPLPSNRIARLVADAIETVVPLRRCTAKLRPGCPIRESPCSPAQLGASMCPCAGTVSLDDYAAVVTRVLRGLTREPELLLEPLRERMAALASAERFEEAADVRDRAAALAAALTRQRRLQQLRNSGRIELDLGEAGSVELDRGRLTRTWIEGELPLGTAVAAGDADEAVEGSSSEAWIPVDLADELACVASWLDANAPRIRLVQCEGTLASSLPAVPGLARPR